jgi:hypothetical protein
LVQRRDERRPTGRRRLREGAAIATALLVVPVAAVLGLKLPLDAAGVLAPIFDLPRTAFGHVRPTSDGGVQLSVGAPDERTLVRGHDAPFLPPRLAKSHRSPRAPKHASSAVGRAFTPAPDHAAPGPWEPPSTHGGSDGASGTGQIPDRPTPGPTDLPAGASGRTGGPRPVVRPTPDPPGGTQPASSKDATGASPTTPPMREVLSGDPTGSSDDPSGTGSDEPTSGDGAGEPGGSSAPAPPGHDRETLSTGGGSQPGAGDPGQHHDETSDQGPGSETGKPGETGEGGETGDDGQGGDNDQPGDDQGTGADSSGGDDHGHGTGHGTGGGNNDGRDGCYGGGQGLANGNARGNGNGNCPGQGVANGHDPNHHGGPAEGAVLAPPLLLLAFAGCERRSRLRRGRRAA